MRQTFLPMKKFNHLTNTLHYIYYFTLVVPGDEIHWMLTNLTVNMVGLWLNMANCSVVCSLRSAIDRFSLFECLSFLSWPKKYKFF